jgi:hypothetical protein
MNSDISKGYQDIEVIPAPSGWMVAEAGKVTGRFDSEESAYKTALAICTQLFEQGIRSRVSQTPTHQG